MTARVRDTAVTLHVRAVGQAFACRGVVRSARTGRVLATTPRVYPHDARSVALAAAKRLADGCGYRVESEESCLYFPDVPFMGAVSS